MSDRLTYKEAGVDIDLADATKSGLAKILNTGDSRVLSRFGTFGALFDADLTGYDHPILVLKIEEPGSKQKLAAQHGRYSSLCRDLIHHLVNDIIVMGAKPLAVLDTIICGKLERETVTEIVGALANACREQECVLVGGETSVQPGVIGDGVYILAASIVGVVEKINIIDGSRTRPGDLVIAVPSNGVHTNGYTLIRKLLDRSSDLAGRKVENETFIESVLRPHYCYLHPFHGLLTNPGVRGIAHITGSGIPGNLIRILPEGVCAAIDLRSIRILPIFRAIRSAAGDLDSSEMLKTFNLGVGMAIVAAAEAAPGIIADLARHGLECYPIGEVSKGAHEIHLTGQLDW